MEHAIRKHCTIHFDEDPAFYKRMSEKLDALIARHGEDWKSLSERYEELRAQIGAGRRAGLGEVESEFAVFRDNLLTLIGDGTSLPLDAGDKLDALAAQVISIIRDTTRIVDFWRKPDQVRRLRASIDTELLVCGVDAIQDAHLRLAVELTRLAEKRHKEMLRA
jgi:type I restriction enzyme R subunit